MPIPKDPQERQKLVKLGQDRLQQSKQYFMRWHERWVRYYQIWRSLADAASSEDAAEPNTFIPYLFSVVEDLVPKATEPLLKLKPPTKPIPRRQGDEKAAENFATVARQFFSTSRYQIEYIASTKEEIITGNGWEKDQWSNQWAIGKRWKRSRVMQAFEMVINGLGLGKIMAPVMKWMLVDDKHPVKVGYNVEFPSVFLMHPCPGVQNVRDLPWLIEEEPAIEVENLREQKFLNPETGKQEDVFDLTEIDKLKREMGDTVIAPTPQNGTDFLSQSMSLISGSSNSTSTGGQDTKQNVKDGIDRVHLIHVYEPSGKLWTIAQSKFVIRVVQLPIARIPFRLRGYTLDPQFLYAMGAIEPVEDMVHELNDIHNLSLANWIRIINRMTAVNTGGLVDEDDLEPRPGGYIRFKGNTNVHNAIREMATQDVSPSMLTMESNSKGLIERATASTDFSPGIAGTKQNHDTATGLLEIGRQVAIRMSQVRRVHMANFQDQMWMMEKLFSFHQFEPTPFTSYGPDGSTVIMMLNNESIYTDGHGFEFIIESDPSFGDDVVQRSLLLAFYDLATKYENWRTTIGGPMAPAADMPNIFRKLSKNFGFEDTTHVLKAPNGILSPESENDIMLAGGNVQVNPQEPLIQHLLTHIAQRNDSEYLQAIESGRVPPEAVAKLDEHIKATTLAISEVMSDPVQFSEAFRPKGGRGPSDPESANVTDALQV